MIGIFLALLELIRQKKIIVHQGDDLTNMVIEAASDEHRKTYEFASLELAQVEEVKPVEETEAGAADEQIDA
jgi:chromatin segregation and condensation protein Rec8/ScpA/Scc1 (kleisin family)